MSDENSIELNLTFATPDHAIPVADRLSDEGWDVTLHVKLTAYITGSSDYLQSVQDQLKVTVRELGLTDKLRDSDLPVT
jgi:hypothetical protein